MKRKKIYSMTLSELEELSTKQLLARLKRLNQCEESFILSDREIKDDNTSESIIFKDSSKWVIEYTQLKKVLAQREHIPKRDELIKFRKERAEKGKRVSKIKNKHKLV